MCCLSLLKVDFGSKKARSLLPPLCAGSGWFAGLAPCGAKGEHQGDEGLDMRLEKLISEEKAFAYTVMGGSQKLILRDSSAGHS